MNTEPLGPLGLWDRFQPSQGLEFRLLIYLSYGRFEDSEYASELEGGFWPSNTDPGDSEYTHVPAPAELLGFLRRGCCSKW